MVKIKNKTKGQKIIHKTIYFVYNTQTSLSVWYWIEANMCALDTPHCGTRLFMTSNYLLSSVVTPTSEI
jgi:hypothetical protein